MPPRAMTVIPSRTTIQPSRLASSPRPAPRACPTSVAAASSMP
nr:hypothetical protein [Fretibacterium fastidiosum]